MKETKDLIRSVVRAKRRELDPAWVEEASARIQQTVTALNVFESALSVACYVALPHEVGTEQLIHYCWTHEKRVCIPAFDEASERYKWAWLTADTDTRIGRWEIPEPEEVQWIGNAQPDVLLIPAVAFDASGSRLGHGGGHYDRILANATGFKIGLAFQWQIVNDVPAGPLDVAVDLVVTEKQAYGLSANAEEENEDVNET